jgi:hypothetical protein
MGLMDMDELQANVLAAIDDSRAGGDALGGYGSSAGGGAGGLDGYAAARASRGNSAATAGLDRYTIEFTSPDTPTPTPTLSAAPRGRGGCKKSTPKTTQIGGHLLTPSPEKSRRSGGGFFADFGAGVLDDDGDDDHTSAGGDEDGAAAAKRAQRSNSAAAVIAVQLTAAQKASAREVCLLVRSMFDSPLHNDPHSYAPATRNAVSRLCVVETSPQSESLFFSILHHG